MRFATALIWIGFVGAPATAETIVDLTVDPAQSIVTVELCVLGSCDTDDSPVVGDMIIQLDAPVDPNEMFLLDFYFELTSNLKLNVGNILGSLSVNLQDVTMSYAFPGLPHGPSELEGDTFAFFNVPLFMSGLAFYDATGVICDFLQSQGLLCADTFDLSQFGVVNAESFTGEISIDGNTVTVTSNPTVVVPLDPDNPDFGQIEFTGVIVAIGIVSVPGDFDGDGDVDEFDVEAYFGCVTGPDAGPITAPCEVFDFDEDDDVDFGDFGVLQRVFTGS